MDVGVLGRWDTKWRGWGARISDGVRLRDGVAPLPVLIDVECDILNRCSGVLSKDNLIFSENSLASLHGVEKEECHIPFFPDKSLEGINV